MEEKALAIWNLMRAFDTLESLPRSGYAMRGVRPAESVAAHGFSTVLLAMLLADAEGGADVEKVLRMAVLHEAGETRLTDIPRTARRFFQPGEVDRAERGAAFEVLKDADGADRYRALFEEYQTCATREARLVRAADKLQMLCKVRIYEQGGAKNLDDFFENDQGMDLEPFPAARALYQLLRSMK